MSSPNEHEPQPYEPTYLSPDYSSSADEAPTGCESSGPGAEPSMPEHVPARAAEESTEPASEHLDHESASEDYSYDPTAPESGTAARAASSAVEPEAEQYGYNPGSQAPDYTYSSGYDSLDQEPTPYDAGYVAPTPAPVVDDYRTPQPAPVQQHLPQQPPNYGYGYGYGYQQPGAPQYGQVQPYGPRYPVQPYPYASFQAAVPEHPSSGAILGLGIASFFVGVTAPIAWYMGAKAKREIAQGAPYRFGGMATTGYVIGIVYTIFMMMFTALIMLAIMFG